MNTEKNQGVCDQTGRAGMIRARNFAKRDTWHAQLVAVADPSEEMAQKACRELNWILTT